MKKLLLLALGLGALAGRARAQAAPADIVVVRIHEGLHHIEVVITRGEGRNEKIEFDNGVSDKNQVNSSEGYYKLFKRLYSEGYVLQGTTTTTYASGDNSTLLFVKKP